MAASGVRFVGGWSSSCGRHQENLSGLLQVVWVSLVRFGVLEDSSLFQIFRIFEECCILVQLGHDGESGPI